MRVLKSILLLTIIAAVCRCGLAQTIIPVSYRGAFEPAPKNAWTDSWANFEPQSTVYQPPTVNIEAGNIVYNTTWTKNNVYNLKGYVYIKEGATLNIQPGTIIRSYGKTALIIERGAKIYANGTMNEPIVFTSLNDGNDRLQGWGGIVICGKARHNIPQGANAIVDADIGALHGGLEDDDSSGVLRYVRIEFAGYIPPAFSFSLSPLSLYSVGSKTVIDYVQVSFSGHDSYQFLEVMLIAVILFLSGLLTMILMQKMDIEVQFNLQLLTGILRLRI